MASRNNDNAVNENPVHASEDLGAGLVPAIERDLEPCLGKGWLRRRA